MLLGHIHTTTHRTMPPLQEITHIQSDNTIDETQYDFSETKKPS